MSAGSVVQAVFAEHAGRLRERARRLSGSEADADDAVQDVMLTLLQRPDLLAPVTSLSAWLLAVTARRCLDVVRAQTRRRGREEAEPNPPRHGEDPHEAVEREETARLVAGVLRGLSPEVRQAFVATALEGRTIADVARETGIPAGTLMARRKKAADALRERLRAREQGAQPRAGRGT